MTIVGVILCFRMLAQEALQDVRRVGEVVRACELTRLPLQVLSVRIPFLLGSVADLKHHVSNGDSLVSGLTKAPSGYGRYEVVGV